VLKTASAGALLATVMLTGCSTTQPPARLSNTVGQLNRDLSRLSAQSAAISYQRQLNANSTRGAWLLPLADSPVALVTPYGRLLTQISPNAHGGLPVLLVKNLQSEILPPFTLTAELAVVSAGNNYHQATPKVLQQQVVQRAVPLAPAEQARFILPQVTLKGDQVLVVNVHQFSPEFSSRSAH